MEEWFIVKNIRDYIEIAFWLFGGFIAWNGLSTWKKQLIGNNKYIFTKRIYQDIYYLQESIAKVRLGPEGIVRISNEIAEKEYLELEKYSEKQRYIYHKLFGKVHLYLENLLNSRPEIDLLFSNEAEKIIGIIYHIESKIKILKSKVSDDIFHYEEIEILTGNKSPKDQNEQIKRNKHLKSRHELKEFIQGKNNEGDVFGEELSTLFKQLKNYFKFNH